ncbi:MAG: hypothetical protein K8H99_04655, partial [Nitrospirae bacterium]|nr:hypothetical protein [Fimbriimonadaceae bacterium]
SMVAYEECLGLHGDSKHQPEIRRRLADAAWRDALAADSIESVVAFLGRFPDHARADDARSRLHDLRWKAVCAEPTLGSYETFVADFPQSPHLPAASASIKSLLVSFAKMEWRIEAVGTASLSEVAGRNDWTVVRVQVRSPIGSPSLVLDSKRFSALDAGGVATPLAAAEVVAAMEVRPETTALGPATPFAPSEYAVARSSIRYSSSGRVRYLDISIGGTTRPRFMLTMLSESDSHTTLPFEACAGWRVLLVFSSPPDKVRKLNLLGRSLKVAPPGTEEGATWVDLQLSPASEWPIHVDPGLALNLGKLAKGQAHKARFVLRSKSGEDLSGAKARLAAPSATGSASVRAIAEGKDLIVEVVV